MKRATLIKRMTPRQRINVLPRSGIHEIVAQTQEKARDLQRVSTELEATRGQVRKEQEHLAKVAESRKNAEARTYDALRTAQTQLERATARLKDADKKKDGVVRELTKLRSDVEDARVAYTKVLKDQELAKKMASERANEEDKLGKTIGMNALETAKLNKLRHTFLRESNAFKKLKAEIADTKNVTKLRAENFEKARKRLANYGKRLAQLYIQKGIGLPEEIIKLPELL